VAGFACPVAIIIAFFGHRPICFLCTPIALLWREFSILTSSFSSPFSVPVVACPHEGFTAGPPLPPTPPLSLLFTSFAYAMNFFIFFFAARLPFPPLTCPLFTCLCFKEAIFFPFPSRIPSLSAELSFHSVNLQLPISFLPG